MDNLTNQVIRGYELRENIGAGGFGAVYRAYQPVVGREVAIKVILPQYANQPEFIRRFETEAQVVARLEHPHIVPLFDYWRDPTGAYLVLRLLKGGSLQSYWEKNRLEIPEVVRLIDQISGALAVAHRNGVIHRDIKPQNILLDEDMNAYLTDFGIAKVMGDPLTDEDEGISGSPAYLAPEQIKSEPITAQTDIYGLGVIIFELLTGVHPFPGSTMTELIFKHLQDPLPDLIEYRPDLPEAINRVIQKATAKNPEERYPDTLSLAEDFRRAAANETAIDSFMPDIDFTNITNPYKGLRAFEEADAADFFGRETMVQQIVARLAEQHELSRFLAVIGPSGSGKSSVVKAGLLPSLRWNEIPGSNNWFIVEMTPGTQPIQRLGEALLSVAVKPSHHLIDQLRSDSHGLLWAVDTIGLNSDLLLVIDQFEEVFTLTENETQRSQFLDLLHTAVTNPDSRVRIIITLRADFMDRPLQYPVFGELIRRRSEFVLPLSADEIERAVTGPAQRVGLQVDSNLLAAIVADVRAEPGALPLLQYALTEVFERRDGRFLTLEAYQNSGGILGALARRADEIYQEFSKEQQAVTRQLFLRLVTLGEGAEDTRRRVHRSELISIASPDVVQTILDTFGKYRLLSFDNDPITREPTIEIAHEALIREWDLLRMWLDNSRLDVRQQRQLNSAAAEWMKANRENSFLLSGSRLGQLEEWAATTDLALTPDERAFIQTSVKERERLAALERERQEREKQLEQRARLVLRSLAAVLFIGIIASLILTAVAVNRSQEAESARATSVINEQLALDNAATATYAQGDALAQANLAATAAAEAQNAATSEAYARATSVANEQLALNSAATAVIAEEQAVLEANNAQTQVAIASTALAVVERNALEAQSVALAANANQALDSDNTDLALALAIEANQIPNPPEQAQNILAQAAYTPGTRYLYEGNGDRMTALAVNPNGQNFLTGTMNGVLTLWDIETGEKLETQDMGIWIHGISFSPDGETAVIALLSHDLSLWDVVNWQEIKTIEGRAQMYTIAYHPNGKMALTGYGRTTNDLDNYHAVLWDLATGEEILHLEGHQDEIQTVAISPDGRLAASGAGDDFEDNGENIVILWDLETGEEIRRFDVFTLRLSTVAFSPDGKILATAGHDEVIILWDVETGEELRRLTGHTSDIESLVFSPNGQFILSGSVDFSIMLWDVATGTQLRRFFGHTGAVLDIGFTPDGRKFVSAGADGSARLWYTDLSVELDQFVDDDPIRTIATSPDGKTLLSGSLSGRVIMWDIETKQEIRRFEGHQDTILNISFHPADQTALVSDYAGGLILWNLATGEQIKKFEGYNETTLIPGAVFSPDGNRAVVTSIDAAQRAASSEVILFNMETYEELWRTEYAYNVVSSVEFTPDGAMILLGSGNAENNGAGELIIVDTETGETLNTLTGHTDTIYFAAASPDGQYALTGSGDLSLILWDLTTGEQIQRLLGHTGIIQGVDFSPDGKMALSASWDKTVRLWNLETGEEMMRFEGHTDRARSVIFSADGQTAFSAGWDGTIRQWMMPLSGQALIDWVLENRYVRELTCAEREQYRVEPLCETDNE